MNASIHGVGLDVVEIDRMRGFLSTWGEAALDRLFGAEERIPIDSRHAPAHFAARFAAKEAFLKALGTGLTGGIAWKEICVAKGPEGAPRLALSGRAARAAEESGIAAVHVTLTHGRDTAAALVILER